MRTVHEIFKSSFLLALAFLCMAMPGGERCGHAEVKNDRNTYVGSKTCRDCHESRYNRHINYSEMALSYVSIELMKKGLTDAEFRECFKCHTTGYGEPGGFRSREETPHLMNAGCEVCHGKGGVHAQTGDPADIRREITIEHCKTCHIPERIESFSFKPLIISGAH